MSLTGLARLEFPLNNIELGEELNTQNQVSPHDQTKDHFFASVELGHPHETQLAVNPASEILHLHCTCEHFMAGAPCAHLWATLRKAETEDWFNIDTEAQERWICDFQFHDDQDEDSGQPGTQALTPDWREWLKNLQNPPTQTAAQNTLTKKPRVGIRRRNPVSTPRRRGVYALDLKATLARQSVVLRFFMQELQPNGEGANIKAVSISHSSIPYYPDPVDQEILWAILGKAQTESELGALTAHSSTLAVMAPDFSEDLLQEISVSKRLYLWDNRFRTELATRRDLHPYQLRPENWYLQLHLRQIDEAFYLQASLTNGHERRRIADSFGHVGAFLYFADFIAKSDVVEHQAWYDLFTRRREIEIPGDELNEFLLQYMRLEGAPTLNLPDELNFTELPAQQPKVRLAFATTEGSTLLRCNLSFVYDELTAGLENHSNYIFDLQKRLKQPRDLSFEAEVRQKFWSLKPIPPRTTRLRNIAADGFFEQKNFLAAAEFGLQQNWDVMAYQQRIERHHDFRFSISSSEVDWFDLQAQMDFGSIQVELPQLLGNIRSGERLVRLSNNTLGILPQDWLQKMKPWADMAAKSEKGLRLSKVQALFLASSMAEGNEKLETDQKFNSLKKVLMDLAELQPQEPGENFHGELRPYQKEGLSWLQMISDNQIGGILADDMGLGKTIQVLALLSSCPRDSERPHLIVTPKSLIFNWIKEAEKFAPHLKILDFTGPQRHNQQNQFSNVDIVLTTYQTLRSDIERLRQRSFDYFILDEAQFIKNPDSQAAMACRLIRAQRRFALSGTPVENSLGDLFSILSVVTPGLLSEAQSARWARESSATSIRSLAKALRPFILRRTKSQVLQDLPEKTEQILYCELSVPERKKYEELRSFYWSNLNQKIQSDGLNRSKIEVLEALLRLRQAACHQGLLDENLRATSSSKFELLLEQIQSVVKDGHKALVFSQFTSLLELLKGELNKNSIAFEYLDGQTTHRQERVENFQNNPDIPLFLLSLKAGGVGLNLTAAEYVFILDPWWNPATESQAIDRTHRIGQNKKVFAYKIIAKDTVEEKIVELHSRKKDLAQNIISADGSLLKSMTLQDLQELFA